MCYIITVITLYYVDDGLIRKKKKTTAHVTTPRNSYYSVHRCQKHSQHIIRLRKRRKYRMKKKINKETIPNNYSVHSRLENTILKKMCVCA